MNYYAVERSTNHLAHYGVKGMKWGVRKAIARGNEKALDRHFRKASKKLKKLQDMGLNSKKYAAKSAAYGAAAAGVGTMAVGGTKMAANIVNTVGKFGARTYARIHPDRKNLLQAIKDDNSHLYNAIDDASDAVEKWGKGSTKLPFKTKINTGINSYDSAGRPHAVYVDGPNKTISNNTLYRIGTGVIATGLAAKSAQNAYRASHGAKYRKKAVDFKNEMDNAFRGTKYEGQYVSIPKKKKRRR